MPLLFKLYRIGFPRGGGGLPGNRGLWVCAAGWGRMSEDWDRLLLGLHIYKSYENGVAHFKDFWGQKFRYVRI